jgi:hypothetical protein
MKTFSPLRAIRAKCLDCSAGQRAEVRLCPVTDCPLHRFRMGRNPNRAGIRGSKVVFGDQAGESRVETDVSAPKQA